MKIYTVYTKDIGPSQLEDLVLVKEGFSWMAAILNFFWAFYHKMWVAGSILLIVNIVFIFLETKGYMEPEIVHSIKVGLLLFIGYNFNDWYRNNLIKQGLIPCGLVSGKNEDEARYKFITHMLHRTTFASGQSIPSLV